MPAKRPSFCSKAKRSRSTSATTMVLALPSMVSSLTKAVMRSPMSGASKGESRAACRTGSGPPFLSLSLPAARPPSRGA